MLGILASLSIPQIVAVIASFVLAITVHEFAHAWVAWRLGDPTAAALGRISLDPRRHLDLAGTLFLLFAGFGWGRPVPVNPDNFRNPAGDNALVAAAGPLSNILLAFAAAFPLNFLAAPDSLAGMGLETFMLINISLAVFNLLPVPPLDGGSIIAPFLPDAANDFLQRYGSIGLFACIAASFAFGWNILGALITPLANILWAAINFATRLGMA